MDTVGGEEGVYAYTLYHRPLSEAYGERITKYHRGWKYASADAKMHQMIYHAEIGEHQDMVFHSNTNLSTAIFRIDGYWQWNDARSTWYWTTYSFTESDEDTEIDAYV